MTRWQSRFQRWLNKRIPPDREFTLGMRNIFIFLSKFGGVFIALSAGLFLLGTNYQNNLMLLLSYFLLALMLMHLFVSYLNFSRLTVQLGKTHHVFANDEVQLPVWFRQNSDQARTPHGQIRAQFWGEAPNLCIDLDAGHNPHFLTLHAEKRGRLALPRLTLSCFYPLGLFRCWTHLAFTSEILVYPRPVPCPVSLTQTEHSEAEHTDSSRPGYDDFDSLAPHRAGEPLYHVAWKQYAKGQGMLSKHFVTDSAPSGWLTMASASSAEIETRLGQLAFQVIELTRQNAEFGLDLGTSIIQPSQGLAHQQACLEALALYPQSSRASS